MCEAISGYFEVFAQKKRGSREIDACGSTLLESNQGSQQW